MKHLSPLTASVLLALVIIVDAASPVSAVTASLANKCRDLAIKAHPPPFPLGNSAYAQAEREFFSACVSQKGQIPPNAK